MSDSAARPQFAETLRHWSELCGVLGAPPVDGPEVFGVKVDSRLVEAGDLFIALPGDPGPRFNPSYRSQIDGHDFVANAIAQGAVGAVVHKDVEVDPNIPLIRVNDTYDGLWQLGAGARSGLRGHVVGVTGSSGKTTAKRFLQAALNGYAPPGSYNNHIGVPLALANAPGGARTCIFEIGTNHPGEILPLAKMVAPELAIVLNVHTAHLENFPSWNDLCDEKISIFNALEDKSLAVREDLIELPYGYSFGLTDSADARVRDLKGDLAEIDLFGETYRVRVPGSGLHRATTVAATMLACHLLSEDLTRACELPQDLVPEGRGNIRRAGHALIVDESYNANPQSMAAALAGFAAFSGLDRKIAVIGEMLELGEGGAAAHLALGSALSEFDDVICVGEASRALAQSISAPWYAKADAALLETVGRIAAGHDHPGIIVKGSNRVFWANGFVGQLTEHLAKQ